MAVTLAAISVTPELSAAVLIDAIRGDGSTPKNLSSQEKKTLGFRALDRNPRPRPQPKPCRKDVSELKLRIFLDRLI